MEKQIIFKGTGTALITPFKNGEIDYPALEKIIELQLLGGISALIVGGTTGEAATLEDNERYELFSFVKEKLKGRAKLIFGTGTNDTKKVIEHTRAAAKIGCDGALVVTPYYNKGTARGIVKHYTAIADEGDLPIILYNVPGRTGVNISLQQLEELAEHERIVAIKEASDSADRLLELSRFGKELQLYAGCDSQIYTVLALGGLGVISVVSNILPGLTNEICRAYFDTDTTLSLKIQQKMLPYINALFKETNPSPIKYEMFRAGLSENELRLPLYPITEETRALLDKERDKLYREKI